MLDMVTLLQPMRMEPTGCEAVDVQRRRRLTLRHADKDKEYCPTLGRASLRQPFRIGARADEINKTAVYWRRPAPAKGGGPGAQEIVGRHTLMPRQTSNPLPHQLRVTELVNCSARDKMSAANFRRAAMFNAAEYAALRKQWRLAAHSVGKLLDSSANERGRQADVISERLPRRRSDLVDRARFAIFIASFGDSSGYATVARMS